MKEIYFAAVTTSQLKMFAKIAASLKKYNVKPKFGLSGARSKTVACWGWRRGRKLRALGHNVLVFERGYLGDRFSWTSVGWNGLNGRADFCLPDKVTSERFDLNFTMLPWRERGKNIIIMGQVRGDASLDSQDLTDFYENLATKLKKQYENPVYFRPHPLSKSSGFKPRIPILEGSLEEAMLDAFLVATYNSNSAVDAVISGVPALSFDTGCMAYDVTGHQAYERIFPDRTEWAARLANCQWTPEEISSAAWWPRLSQKLRG